MSVMSVVINQISSIYFVFFSVPSKFLGPYLFTEVFKGVWGSAHNLSKICVHEVEERRYQSRTAPRGTIIIFPPSSILFSNIPH